MTSGDQALATSSASTSTSGLTPARLYRALALAETVTWTLLIIAMVLKYAAGQQWVMFPAGITHGLVFVSYAATALLVGLNQRWHPGQVVVAIATAIIPFATIPCDRSLERRGMLTGPWRTQASDDPRDQHVVDRLLRWGLRNPVLLAVIIIAAVAVVVTVLLQLGPPTQWGR